MVTDRLVTAIVEANARVSDVTFLALIGRPNQPISICMCADYLVPLTLYEGADLDQALAALNNAVASLEKEARPR